MNPLVVMQLRNAAARLALAWASRSTGEQIVIDHPLPFSSMNEENWRTAVRLWRAHARDLLSTVPPRGCPACDCEQSRWLFESYDLHPYHECDRCGCWFVPKHVDWRLFERFFAINPDASVLAREMMGQRNADAARDADMARIGGYLDQLSPLLRADERPVSYLDSGCGVGHSLRAAQQRGLRAQGIEVDDAALAIARADGLPVVTPDEPLPPGPYQLLSFWETLEHIDDPLGALTRYLPLLADDGLVAITVPNLNALATRILRDSCPWIHGGYNTPGHVNMFHAPSLERLLARAGLTVIDSDAQFSANPVELLAALRGATRGAFDTLDDRTSPGAVPAAAVQAVQGIWPGFALIERLALASPILWVVACRTGQQARFAQALADIRAQRERDLADQAHHLFADETDYLELANQLQEEIDRREADARRNLTALEARLQGEIDRRDALIAEAERRYASTFDQQLKARLDAMSARISRWFGRTR